MDAGDEGEEKQQQKYPRILLRCRRRRRSSNGSVVHVLFLSNFGKKNLKKKDSSTEPRSM